jgi:tetratricopeptide (TPR) repeat protein
MHWTKIKFAKLIGYILLMSIGSFWACKKDWLEKNPDSNQTVLQSLSDFQALLDNPNICLSSCLGEVGTDNYFIEDSSFTHLGLLDLHCYLWAYNGYGVASNPVWTNLYNNIFACNTVLSGLEKIPVLNSPSYKAIKGAALFWRGFDFYELAQGFCKSYDSAGSPTDPGIPLRLSTDINRRVGRGNVAETYQQIIRDLEASLRYLPDVQDYPTRPVQWAAFAVLARVYLSMGIYEKALDYADSALSIHSALLDYNSIGDSVLPDFSQNPEVLLYCRTATADLGAEIAKVDSILYQSYSANDLRKKYFFQLKGRNRYSFKGSYANGKTALFSAPASDEIYLIAAECEARSGNTKPAMKLLNELLKKRFVSGSFTDYVALDPGQTLQIILKERRKELLMRMTRWGDLKRLNKDPRFAVQITRVYQGQNYELAANSNLYCWPIPDDEILASGIAQNPR